MKTAHKHHKNMSYVDLNLFTSHLHM